MNIPALNESMFKENTVLHADELNTLAKKINAIITAIEYINGLLSNDDISKLAAADDELNRKIDEINKSLATAITNIANLAEGKALIDNNEEFALAIKQQCNTVLLDLNVAKKITNPDGSTSVVPAVDILAAQKVNDLYKSGSFDALPGTVGMVANFFNSDGTPKYNGAQIIASINDDGVSSVGINADKITISGDTNLTSKLTALDIAVAGSLSASTLSAEKYITLDNQRLSINADTSHQIGEIEIVESGNSDHGCVYTKLSNEEGLNLLCAENTSGITGSVVIGRYGVNKDFGISVSRQVGSATPQSGVGYTGPINGANYINGICVGIA